MKKQILLSLAVVGMLFTSCADIKEKKTEEIETVAQSQLELIENDELESSQGNLMETLESNETFTSLILAIKATELDSVLTTKGPFTLFAPSNVAFEELGKKQLNELLETERNQELRSALMYHLIEGDLDASSIIRSIEEGDGLFEVKTLHGKDLSFSLEDDKLVLSSANGQKASVVVADIEAANGVIHSIDAVLIPKE